MGRLYYANNPEPVELPDRLLAHLKVVIATKLRRNESFSIAWDDATGRHEWLWLDAAVPLRVVVDDPDLVLDPGVLRTLTDRANTSAGLTVDLDEEIARVDRQTRSPARGRTGSIERHDVFTRAKSPSGG